MANIPGAVMGAGGPRPPSAIHELLMALAQTAMQAGAQYAVQRAAPPSAADQTVAQNQAGAFTGLADMATHPQPSTILPGQIDLQRQAQQALVSMGIGNANTTSQDLHQSAPTMYAPLAQQRQEQATSNAEAGRAIAVAGAAQNAKDTERIGFEQRFLSQLPADYQTVGKAWLNMRALGGDTGGPELIKTLIPGEAERQKLEDAHTIAETDHLKAETTRMRRSEAGLQEFADTFGYQRDMVTPELMNDVLKAQNPAELTTRLMVAYMAPHFDPITGATVYPDVNQAFTQVKAGVDKLLGRTDSLSPDETKQAMDGASLITTLEQGIEGQARSGKTYDETMQTAKAAWAARPENAQAMLAGTFDSKTFDDAFTQAAILASSRGFELGQPRKPLTYRAPGTMPLPKSGSGMTP